MASDVTTVVSRMIVSCRRPADQTRATAALIVPTVDNVADVSVGVGTDASGAAGSAVTRPPAVGTPGRSLVRRGCTASSCRAGCAAASIDGMRVVRVPAMRFDVS